MATWRFEGECFTTEESKRLFSDDLFSVEVVHLLNDGPVQSRIASNIHELEVEISNRDTKSASSSTLREDASVDGLKEVKKSSLGSQQLYFLNQSDSWSHIKISFEGFQKISDALSICKDIQFFVCAFGSRVRDSDTNVGGHFSKVWNPTLHDGSSSRVTYKDPANPVGSEVDSNDLAKLRDEFCYCIRYPEQHGRDLEDPWVMRRVLVYHQQDFESQNSSWVLLQCPPHLQQRLISMLDASRHTELFFIEQAKMHVFVMSTISKGWRAYINHLEMVVEDLEEIACFSRVGRTHPFDYSATFADAQLLQQYIRIILKAREAIETSLGAFKGLMDHIKKIAISTRSESSCQGLHMELEGMVQQLQLHRRSAVALFEYSNGLLNLLLNLLSYRNDEKTHRNGDIVHQDGQKLQHITSCAHATSEEQRELLQCTVKDYRIMKTLTYVTILYLPVNLVAAIFNSNLLQVSLSDDVTASKSHSSFRVLKEIWIFFVLSVCLTLITICAALPMREIPIFAYIRRKFRSII